MKSVIQLFVMGLIAVCVRGADRPKFAGMPYDYVANCFNKWRLVESGTGGSGHGYGEDSLVGAATFAAPSSKWPAEADAGIELLCNRLKSDGWKVGGLAGAVPVSVKFVTKMMFTSTRGEETIYTVITIVPKRDGVVTVVWNQNHWEKSPNHSPESALGTVH